jgi:hypothetical protein
MCKAVYSLKYRHISISIIHNTLFLKTSRYVVYFVLVCISLSALLLNVCTSLLHSQHEACILIYLHHAAAFLEKPTGLQLVKKFPSFYRTRRFITAFTNAHHLSLSWATAIQPISPHAITCRSILILSSHIRLDLPSGLFPDYPTKTLHTSLPSPSEIHASPITFFSILSPAQ